MHTKAPSHKKFIALLILLAMGGLALFTGYMPSEYSAQTSLYKSDHTYKSVQAPKGT
ncbi:hypothetical protein [Sansalvadorimonas verongulae]|uniref:hypothetical protein n=1 Tax=Sansalvadorimonas verongulae TaxID=2172824 RepID=UPI0012BC6CB1|nr:hypothetical protein [Sansalvadorimonas verongulae]